jgi:hypothetical protein
LIKLIVFFFIAIDAPIQKIVFAVTDIASGFGLVPGDDDLMKQNSSRSRDKRITLNAVSSEKHRIRSDSIETFVWLE